MRKLIITLALFVLTVNVSSQTVYIPYTHETLTISNSALPFTAGKLQDVSNSINKAAYVVFDVSCAGGVTTCILRYTVDGTTPTASIGHRAFHGDTISIIGRDAATRFRGIRENATDVISNVTYYRK